MSSGLVVVVVVVGVLDDGAGDMISSSRQQRLGLQTAGTGLLILIKGFQVLLLLLCGRSSFVSFAAPLLSLARW